MRFELLCPVCSRRFAVPANSPVAAALDRVAAEGPCCVTGDGQTLEDRLFASLEVPQAVPCPECGHPVAVTEQSLCSFAQELLAQW